MEPVARRTIVFVLCRQWTQPRTGNTYVTTETYIDGCTVRKTEPEYCNGEQWKYDAVEWLRANTDLKHFYGSGHRVENHNVADSYRACVKYVDKYQPDTASTSEREHYEECMKWITPDPVVPVIDGLMTAGLVIMLLSAAIMAVFAAYTAKKKKNRFLSPSDILEDAIGGAFTGLAFGAFLGTIVLFVGLGVYYLGS